MNYRINKKSVLLVIISLSLAVALLLFFGYFKGLFTPKPRTIPRPIITQEEGRAFPAEIIDLRNWKLTLPVVKPENQSLPLDIQQPQLAQYRLAPWFDSTSDNLGVVFRAPVNAPTTKNSDYPRTELREMNSDGTQEALWPSKKGIHTMILDEAITAVPKNKPAVVAGQIHGDDDDLLVIRLEDGKLHVTRSKQDVYTLDENYFLGKRFTVKFVASDGKISVYYNNGISPVFTLNKKVDLAYFKAGVYTQSNCETEKDSNLCSANNYGEVIIYKIKVTHE